MTEPRIKLGQYLFLRHGGKIVFFGRFIAVLRAAAAFLAGAHGMTWRRFLVFNFAGAAVWATLYGLTAYLIGAEVDRLVGPVGIGLGVAAGLGLAVAFVFAWRHEQRLIRRAERALPGPVRADPQLA
jgi:membrane protein DedA with SNARE-associated domain